MGWRIINSAGRTKGATGGGWQIIDSSGNGKLDVIVASLNSGTSAGSTTFWRGDGTWSTVAGGTFTNSSDEQAFAAAHG